MISERVKFLPKSGDGDTLLPAVIAVMIFMTALALVGAVALGDGIRGWSASLEGQITVQIVTADARERRVDTESALRLLRATPGISSAEVLADSEVMSLVAPWLGRIPADSGLPLPNLIDVRLRPGANLNTAAIAERLHIAAPSAVIDDHQSWLTQILDLANLVRLTLGSVVILVLLCTAAIVIFGCRAGLAAHKDTIAIMHLLGAEDGLIAGAFDRRYFIHGFQGGLFGMLIAAVVLWGIMRLSHRLGEGLLIAIVPEASTLWWLLLLPFGTALLTALTARVTVRRVLLAMM